MSCFLQGISYDQEIMNLSSCYPSLQTQLFIYVIAIITPLTSVLHILKLQLGNMEFPPSSSPEASFTQHPKQICKLSTYYFYASVSAFCFPLSLLWSPDKLILLQTLITANRLLHLNVNGIIFYTMGRVKYLHIKRVFQNHDLIQRDD